MHVLCQGDRSFLGLPLPSKKDVFAQNHQHRSVGRKRSCGNELRRDRRQHNFVCGFEIPEDKAMTVGPGEKCFVVRTELQKENGAAQTGRTKNLSLPGLRVQQNDSTRLLKHRFLIRDRDRQPLPVRGTGNPTNVTATRLKPNVVHRSPGFTVHHDQFATALSEDQASVHR